MSSNTTRPQHSTLSIALQKVEFFPPTRVTDDTSILTLKNLVFEPLLHWQNGDVRPGLFSRWTHSSDGRRWQFFIRDGARFHDGKACVADDIIEFVDGILQSVDTFGMKWSYARYLAHASITVGADDRVDVANPEPIADILDIFSEFFICRKAADGTATLGTGPWQVEDFVPGQRAVLVEARVVADAAKSIGAPAIDRRPRRIIAHAIAGAEDRYRALRDGRVDAALGLEHMAGPLQFDDQFGWYKAANTLSVMYYLNCFDGLFCHPAARLAINLAIDTRHIVEHIYHGLAIPAASIVSPYHLGMREARIQPIAYDPDRAKQLLDAAMTDGATAESTMSGRLRLRTPTFMPEHALEISDFVAGALRQIGLEVDIDIQTDRPEYAREIGAKQVGDLAIFDSSPHSTYRVLNDKISSEVKAVWWQGYDDADVEQLVGIANRRVTLADREQAYARVLERLNANPPWLYLVHPVNVLAARGGVNGLSIDNKGVLSVT